MKTVNCLFKQVLFFVFLALTLSISAQIGSYEPVSGQAGKNVVWVPTSQVLVNKMLDMAKVKPGDYVIDLGSGDGRLVITAAKKGATALGIEYNPKMVQLSREKAAKAGVSNKAKFMEADLFKTDLSKATVVTLFLLRSINLELRPTLLKLKPGTRIVSNTFDMDDWEPDEKAYVEGCDNGFCNALLWIVPANVQGTWKIGDDKLVLEQKFQKISGTLNDEKISNGRIRGTEISFKVKGNTYKGTISEGKIQGSLASNQGNREWIAVLQKKVASNTP